MTERDDEAWRAIVENYGERAALDDEGHDADTRAGSDLRDRPGAGPDEADGPGEADRPADPGSAAEDDLETSGPAGGTPFSVSPTPLGEQPPPPEEGFVPPPAPPLPYVPPRRLAAGLGVFGAPLVLLVCVVLGISIPGWLAYLLVASFVGGFAWLVAHMRKRPEDPWDDGARV